MSASLPMLPNDVITLHDRSLASFSSAPGSPRFSRFVRILDSPCPISRDEMIFLCPTPPTPLVYQALSLPSHIRCRCSRQSESLPNLKICPVSLLSSRLSFRCRKFQTDLTISATPFLQLLPVPSLSPYVDRTFASYQQH